MNSAELECEFRVYVCANTRKTYSIVNETKGAIFVICYLLFFQMQLSCFVRSEHIAVNPFSRASRCNAWCCCCSFQYDNFVCWLHPSPGLHTRNISHFSVCKIVCILFRWLYYCYYYSVVPAPWCVMSVRACMCVFRCSIRNEKTKSIQCKFYNSIFNNKSEKSVRSERRRRRRETKLSRAHNIQRIHI